MTTKKESTLVWIGEIELDKELFGELEENGCIKVVLCRQRIGEGIKYFVKKLKGES